MEKFLFSAILLVTLTGCTLVTVNAPSGTSSGMLFQNQTYGGKDGSSKAEARISTVDTYSIVGPVSVSGDAKSFLGLLGMGNTGYGLLVKEAKKAGADDIINVYADTKHTSVLLGLYTSSTVTYYGTAIKYNRTRQLNAEVIRDR